MNSAREGKGLLFISSLMFIDEERMRNILKWAERNSLAFEQAFVNLKEMLIGLTFQKV